MKCLVVLSVLVAVASAGSLHRVRRANGDQNPKVWDALDKLRGKAPLGTDQIQEIYAAAQPGQDFPILSEIPQSNIDCASFKQPGFYADDSSRCQVFHRCDVNGNLTSYLCPNMTVFNQITLICDWFWNVDCSQSKQFQDYSNSRLYTEKNVLLDNQDDYELQAAATGAVQSSASASASKPSSSKSSKSSSSKSSSSSSSSKKSSGGARKQAAARSASSDASGSAASGSAQASGSDASQSQTQEQ
ncbi:hypothetical protein RvY_06615 [Ramazzottius varieornatus]|uniref:Chitin-binding type-2 domain-containing protein n=1 Tax=Ramazzottius varieornatus TaxID=947166 RepID=A0A1D1UZ82_RAMVA|nr:hypothetical protein RvY_06615 [Ramazzottius varieornatus]